MVYIFDVNWTLTPPGHVIDKKFKSEFISFCKNNKVWLVTGSDKRNTVKQIGQDTWLAADRVYQNNGNQLWINNTIVRQSDWCMPSYLKEYLDLVLDQSSYPYRFGNHIEERIGMINFSVVGNNSNTKQRNHYFKWDKIHQQRIEIVKDIKERFSSLDASIGGKLCIDIYEKGFDKGQIVKDLEGEYFTFFGDQLYPGGNDYPIKKVAVAEKLNGNKFYYIKSWKDTRSLPYFNINKDTI
jgi:HAD superfamily hydrolase (TIGR01484 family)